MKGDEKPAWVGKRGMSSKETKKRLLAKGSMFFR